MTNAAHHIMAADLAFLQQAAAPLAQGAPDDRATEFTAVDGHEQYSGSTLLVVAYGAIWLILMGYILFLWRKSGTLAERLDGLERTLDRTAAEAEKKAKARAS